MGSTVKIYDREFEEEMTYTVVGSAEADPLKGYISDESPVGKVLIGKSVGDRVTVEAPAGEFVYEILAITK